MFVGSCGHCGTTISDYASNRRDGKHGKRYFSARCRVAGSAADISVSHGGDGVACGNKSKADAKSYKRHVEARRTKAMRNYKLNRDAIVSKIRERKRQLKAEVMNAYGGACACCGESHIEFLTIDHVDGSGAEHRRRVGKGEGIYRDLKARGFPKDGYQVLCLNCNIALGFYGYCPHRPEVKRAYRGQQRGRAGRKRSVA